MAGIVASAAYRVVLAAPSQAPAGESAQVAESRLQAANAQIAATA